MTQADELLPCPLCNRKTTVNHTKFGWETISCTQCNLSVGAAEHSHPNGVILKRWNTRTPHPDTAAVKAAVEAATKRSNYPWSNGMGYTTQDHKNEGCIEFARHLLTIIEKQGDGNA